MNKEPKKNYDEIIEILENPKFEDKIKLNKDSKEYWRGFNNCIKYLKTRIINQLNN